MYFFCLNECENMRGYFCIQGSDTFILKISFKTVFCYFRNSLTACSVTFSISFYAYINIGVYI